ncbi:hypothetical protein ACJ73_04163 [Blastomyces percursus]|uniref:IMP-specific 5'-nucleotidase 1 n=1 Tax=Blastomyces percursus TaxID=1658174 RepID=A0A1J9R7L6_9EURO|nr:hypothetical protein ACJ73_04163 [Blastomyces percursus]
MTTRYRVEYALKVGTELFLSHRRDQLIEWIKGLLAVPFVLHSQPTALYQEHTPNLAHPAAKTHDRYVEIMHDVENLINDHISHQKVKSKRPSKLKLLVPSIGSFFTPLLLVDAFKYQDKKRSISSRRFVPPSFNDIRNILNTAQLLGLIKGGGVDLITFDGDVTLYDDGASLTMDNPVIQRIIRLLHQGKRVGIVTAAGYTEALRYYERLHGLLDNVKNDPGLNEHQQNNLIVMGGESNFLFKFDSSSPDLLSPVERGEWLLDDMKLWKEEDITELLDIAETALRDCMTKLKLPATLVRKPRAVGISPLEGSRMQREQLEETVLVAQQTVEFSSVGGRLPFCAFNGGNDVFIDIGDKSWGVRACQRYFGGIPQSKTLHIGDQFLSAGSNDFKVLSTPSQFAQHVDNLVLTSSVLQT